MTIVTLAMICKPSNINQSIDDEQQNAEQMVHSRGEELLV